MSNPDLLQPGQQTTGVQPLNAITKPLPATKASTKKAYSCTVPVASFHRQDGKRIPFVFGFYETDILHDQVYLDNEIANGNPYLSHATEEQITTAKMRLDPRGTIREQVTKELEGNIRADLEAKIRAEMEAKYANAAPGSVEATQVDASKLAGTDAASRLAALREKNSQTSGNATVTPRTTTVSPAQALGVKSTADLAGTTAESNSK